MSALRATVRFGRLVIDDAIGLPEGTQVQLYLVDAGDELDDAARAALDDAIDAAAESVARGEVIGAEEVLRRIWAADDPSRSGSRRRQRLRS